MATSTRKPWLAFTPLFTERYDLVFNADRAEGEDLRRLLSDPARTARNDGHLVSQLHDYYCNAPGSTDHGR